MQNTNNEWNIYYVLAGNDKNVMGLDVEENFGNIYFT